MGLFQSNELVNVPELPIELYAKILYHTNNVTLLKYVSKEISKINLAYISYYDSTITPNIKEVIKYYERISLADTRLLDHVICTFTMNEFFTFNLNKIFTVSYYYNCIHDGYTHSYAYPHVNCYNRDRYPTDDLFITKLRNYDLKTIYDILSLRNAFAKKTCIDTLNYYCKTMPLLHSWLYMEYSYKRFSGIIYINYENEEYFFPTLPDEKNICSNWDILRIVLMGILENLPEKQCGCDTKYIMKFV